MLLQNFDKCRLSNKQNIQLKILKPTRNEYICTNASAFLGSSYVIIAYNLIHFRCYGNIIKVLVDLNIKIYLPLLVKMLINLFITIENGSVKTLTFVKISFQFVKSNQSISSSAANYISQAIRYLSTYSSKESQSRTFCFQHLLIHIL
jgi:hypothetical protein